MSKYSIPKKGTKLLKDVNGVTQIINYMQNIMIKSGAYKTIMINTYLKC